MTPNLRRAGAALVTVLLAALVPVVVSAPAGAAACTDETHDTSVPLGATGCDDTTPPETAVTYMDPLPTFFGSVRSTSVTFTFAGAYAPGDSGDSGPIGFECQLYNTPSAPTQWEECTSPKSYDDLTSSTSKPYTFRVRAVDQNDEAIQACDSAYELGDLLCAGEEKVDDKDPSPAVVAFRVDTSPPNTFLDGEPVDPLTPDWPVVSAASVQLQLNSNETAGFACTLNGKSFKPCDQGTVTLPDLASGSYEFVARAYDAAFNIDPTPVRSTFFVPSNIKKNKSSPWTTRRQAGLFGNDYLTADKVGQVVVIHGARKVREVRLLAPTGPSYGKVEVRIGESQWYTVDLHSTKRRKLVQLLVRDEYTTERSGDIQIRVKQLDPGKTVRIDAIVARGACTTCAREG